MERGAIATITNAYVPKLPKRPTSVGIPPVNEFAAASNLTEWKERYKVSAHVPEGKSIPFLIETTYPNLS
jgi:hypothetical protein